MICFPLDATDYSANALGAYLCTRTRGVFCADNNLKVTAATGMSIIVGAGLAWLKMSEYWGTVTLAESDTVLSLKAADGVLSRKDVVVCRIDKINNRAEIFIRTGAFAGKPVHTPPVRDDNYDEVYLAACLVSPGMVTMTQENITDLRLDETCCGVMRDGVNGIPTAALQAQVQELVDHLSKEIIGIEQGSEVMLKAVYDKNSDGVVDNAYKLDGRPAAFYMGMVFQNLLDNSSLTINQRAQSAYTTADYCVDRWRISGTSALAVPTRTLTAAVYSVKSSAIFQSINNTEKELAIGDSLSFSAKINGTIYTGTSVILDRGLYTSFLDVPYAFENDAFGVICCTAVGNTAITNFNIVPKKALAIEWVKLEKGTIATPYVPKGYGAELAECQRYYQKYTVRFTEILGYVALGHILLHSIPLSPPMRIAPSVFCTVLDIQGVDIASVEGASRGNTGIIVGMQPTAAFLHILMNVRITADL